jgi:hypothetical protein
MEGNVQGLLRRRYLMLDELWYWTRWIAITLNGERCSLVTQGCNRSFGSNVAQRDSRFYKLPFFCWFVAEKYLGPAGRTVVSWYRLMQHCWCSYCCVSWPRNDDKRIRRRQTPLLLASIHTLTGWEEAMNTVSQILGMPNPASSFLFFVQIGTYASCEEPDLHLWSANC